MAETGTAVTGRELEPEEHGGALLGGRGRRLPELDGLRGLAILLVVVLHFSFLEPHSSAEQAYIAFTSAGWIGVDLFFVLSGFLITGILLDSKGNGAFFRTFFVRRFLRIFPLYYGYLVLIFLIVPILDPHPPEPNHIWSWTFMNNVLMSRGGWEALPAHTTHLWSLAVEEQFYLFWPLIVFWLDRDQLIRLCVAAFGLAIFARLFFALTTGEGVAGYALLPSRLDPLAAGALLAALSRTPSATVHLRRFMAPAAVGATVVLVGLGAENWILSRHTAVLPPLDFWTQMIGYPALAILFAALLLIGVEGRQGSSLRRLLRNPALRDLGKYSYALYLLHIPLRDAMRSYFAAIGGMPEFFGSQLPFQILVLLVGMGLSYAAAVASWHILEKHFLLLKDRLAPSRTRPAHAPARLIPDSAAAKPS